MVAMYTIAGRQIGSHYLAMATLGSMAGLITYSLSGGEKNKAQGPPIKAQSADEEKFIREFMQNAEAEEKKAHGGK